MLNTVRPCQTIRMLLRLSVLWLSIGSCGFAAADPAPQRIKELVHLVRQDCGSCHGLTLKGGIGPSLLPEALRDKPVDSLRYTVLMGRPGTAMPPWKAFLSDDEAEWIVGQLMMGFPQEGSAAK